MPDTKPGVILDENGRCNGCRASDHKKKVDWDSRWRELEELANKIKANRKSTYDCLVPVSGGKDSWYQAWVMSQKLGLKTLCVVMGSHLPTEEGIHNLNSMIKDLNVDTLKITLKPSVLKKLRKKCFIEQGEPNWAEHCYILSGVVNAALLYDVPLIVWGEDISFEFGGLQSQESKPSAIEIDKNDLLKDKTVDYWLGDDISPRDVFFYRYPEYKRLAEAGIESIYLGHFHKWDGRFHYNFVKDRGFQERKEGPLSGNYIPYDNIDEKLCEINIWLKYIKFGFWRPTDQTCYDIWNDRMTRDEAVEIVNRLQDDFPKEYLEDFLRFHNMTETEFWETVERFRNHEIWNKVDGHWEICDRPKKTGKKTSEKTI
jgi:N-acetyl sugar amidotransferase